MYHFRFSPHLLVGIWVVSALSYHEWYFHEHLYSVFKHSDIPSVLPRCWPFGGPLRLFHGSCIPSPSYQHCIKAHISLNPHRHLLFRKLNNYPHACKIAFTMVWICFSQLTDSIIPFAHTSWQFVFLLQKYNLFYEHVSLLPRVVSVCLCVSVPACQHASMLALLFSLSFFSIDIAYPYWG